MESRMEETVPQNETNHCTEPKNEYAKSNHNWDEDKSGQATRFFDDGTMTYFW